MPSRIIREGILTSERINELDASAEVFYRRLLSKVDDHGLYDARPAILRTSLYPLRVDRVREADISRWMAACQKAGLLALYAHDGKPYLQALDTRWKTRSEPKFPLPPVDESNGMQTTVNNRKQEKTTVALDVDVDVVVDGDVGVGVTPARKRAGRTRKTPIPDDFKISKRVEAWAKDKGHGQLDAHLEAFVDKAKAKDYAYADWDAAFMGAIRDDWAGLAGKPVARQRRSL